MAEPAVHAAREGDPPGPSDELRLLLRDDETLLWSTKPHARGWHVGTVVGLTLGLSLAGAIFGVPAAWVTVLDGSSSYPLGPGSTALLVLGALLGIAVGASLLAHALYRHAELALTDERLVRFGGLVGRDVSTVALEDVRDIEVRVYPLDKLYGTGRIHVQVPGGGAAGLSMGYVPDPYGTLEQIERLRAQATGEADESG